MTSVRSQVHELVETLPEERLQEALAVLHGLSSVELTPEDEAAILASEGGEFVDGDAFAAELRAELR